MWCMAIIYILSQLYMCSRASVAFNMGKGTYQDGIAKHYGFGGYYVYNMLSDITTIYKEYELGLDVQARIKLFAQRYNFFQEDVDFNVFYRSVSHNISDMIVSYVCFFVMSPISNNTIIMEENSSSFVFVVQY